MRLVSLLFSLSCALVQGGRAGEARPPSKPAVILVPGAFHTPGVFYKVADRLAGAGYSFIDAVALPSAGQLVDRQADVDAVKKVLRE